MGKYINEDAKPGMRWILILWDENRSKNAELPDDQQRPDQELLPDFTQYDKDPRTPKANSLAQYFTSYGGALKEARYYDRHRDELEPKISVPSNVTKPRSKPKPKQKASPVQSPPQKTAEAPQSIQASTTLQEAAEAPQSVQTPDSSTSTAEAPKKPSRPSPMYQKFGFGSNNPHRRPATNKDPHATLTQSIGSLIPPELFSSFENNDKEPEKPAPKPSKPEPKKPKETPKVPQPTADSITTASDFAKLPITNYLPGKLAFISKNYYLAYKEGDIQLGEDYKIVIDGDDAEFAKVIKAKKTLAQYEADSNEGNIQVSLTEIISLPKIEKAGKISAFPEPVEGQILLVEKEVAEAAKRNGRNTDDLIFPRHYLRTKNGIFLCLELGKL